MSELCAAKQEIIERVRASLAYLPDDPAEAEDNHPWLAMQLNQILDGIGHEDIPVFDLLAVIALLGPAFARALTFRGDGPESSGREPRLHVV